MKRSQNRNYVLYVCQAGIIGALYTVITVLIGPLGNTAVQCRISEALCVLPFFTPAAIPGVTIGCLVSNLLTGGVWQDVVFGTLATLLGAVGARLLRKFPWLVPLPTVIANTVIVPLVLAFAYHDENGLLFLFLSVGLGEVISAYVLGMALLMLLRRHPVHAFHLES